MQDFFNSLLCDRHFTALQVTSHFSKQEAQLSLTNCATHLCKCNAWLTSENTPSPDVLHANLIVVH